MKAILACDKNNGIGLNNDLPWPYIKEDFQVFVDYTRGKPLLMGRNTWDSLPKKPLPKRPNLVLSSTMPESEDYIRVRSLDVLKEVCDANGIDYDDLIVMGGATLYEHFLPMCSEISVSLIDGDYETDTRVSVLNTIVDKWNMKVVKTYSNFTHFMFSKPNAT